MEENRVWPPPIADKPNEINTGTTKPHKFNKVAVFGHLVALLPVGTFFMMALWRYFSIYDNNLDLIGPTWIVNMGGELAAFVPVPFCLLGGVGAIISGSIGRRWLTIGEGLWSCVAAVMLTLWYMVVTF